MSHSEEHTMEDNEPITLWIDQMRQGDDESVRLIWENFVDRLLIVAKNKLQAANRSSYDEEDAVLSAFKSFCAGVRRGQYPQLRDREDLWRLLFVITARKVADRFAFQSRDKRDVRREVAVGDLKSSINPIGDQLVSSEPSPEFLAECTDQLNFLLDQLQLDDLKKVALSKMEGYTNQEIAQIMKLSLTTIERKLRTIREIWGRAQP